MSPICCHSGSGKESSHLLTGEKPPETAAASRVPAGAGGSVGGAVPGAGRGNQRGRGWLGRDCCRPGRGFFPWRRIVQGEWIRILVFACIGTGLPVHVPEGRSRVRLRVLGVQEFVEVLRNFLVVARYGVGDAFGDPVRRRPVGAGRSAGWTAGACCAGGALALRSLGTVGIGAGVGSFSDPDVALRRRAKAADAAVVWVSDVLMLSPFVACTWPVPRPVRFRPAYRKSCPRWWNPRQEIP